MNHGGCHGLHQMCEPLTKAMNVPQHQKTSDDISSKWKDHQIILAFVAVGTARPYPLIVDYR